jgi:hypothetical protein
METLGGGSILQSEESTILYKGQKSLNPLFGGPPSF